MAKRAELQSELERFFEEQGCDRRNVYYQPPESVKLRYPCIIYERSGIEARHADGKPYTTNTRYTLTIIDRNPDSRIAEKLLERFPMCRYDRHFMSDNLHHDAMNLYY